MKKLKLYIETSVWNFLIAEDIEDENRITKKLFQEIKQSKYEIFVSELGICRDRKSAFKDKTAT